MKKPKPKNFHGGARKGAGAKKKEDKKIPVTVYFYESRIETLGGLDEFKNKIYEEFEN